MLYNFFFPLFFFWNIYIYNLMTMDKLKQHAVQDKSLFHFFAIILNINGLKGHKVNASCGKEMSNPTW